MYQRAKQIHWDDDEEIELEDAYLTYEDEGFVSKMAGFKFIEIDGGNYSFMAFLSKGTQNSDNEALISRDEQQSIVQSELEALMLEVDLSIGGKGY